eukprot:TRINITY_DN3471_c0_g2_i1.p1 TRINITY_DN3471_c0_g2~~TRINITY_DN3471_c0_g2_i1.p1  ORF type:complete len:299 (-),score=64.11 TRINITY_DN3471_c0_g2_i1:4-900(-)
MVRRHTVSDVDKPVLQFTPLKDIPPPMSPPRIDSVGTHLIHPSFIFLQLNLASFKDVESPFKLPDSPKVTSAISELDRRLSMEIFKFGVLYVARGQINKPTDILKNSYGSPLYTSFLRDIGELYDVREGLHGSYTGGLREEDGDHMLIWKDDITQVVYHVATLIPNLDAYPNSVNKLLHIGNDYVIIVYNDDDEEYDINLFPSDFNLVAIVVKSLDSDLYRIDIKSKVEVPLMGPIVRSYIVNKDQLGLIVLQCAISADMAVQRIKDEEGIQFSSQCEYRLEQFKKIRKMFVNCTNNE